MRWFDRVPTWLLDDPGGLPDLSLWRETPDGCLWKRMTLKALLRPVFDDLSAAEAGDEAVGICEANRSLLECAALGLPDWFDEFQERLMAIDAPPFTPATRAIRNVIIGLVGDAAAGKTCSALRLARGIAGPEGRIVLIDTEYGRPTEFAPGEGEVVSDQFDPAMPLFNFAVHSMDPPFDPLAYRAAAHQASKMKPAVLIIDNISDEHFAMCEMADAASDKRHAMNWQKPRNDHRQLMKKLRLHPWYVILCVRARTALIENKEKGEAKGDLHMMCESGLVSDSTVWQAVHKGGYPLNSAAIPTKWPAALRGLIDSKKPLSEETGRLIAKWAQPKGVWEDLTGSA